MAAPEEAASSSALALDRISDKVFLDHLTKVLTRHPSFLHSLNSPSLRYTPPNTPTHNARQHNRLSRLSDGGPAQFGLRKWSRRFFYIAVTFTLLMLATHIGRLYAIEKATQAEYELVKRERLERQKQSKNLGQVVRSALTMQSGLIAVNLILAFRGVQLWRLIQRIDLVEWINRISPAFPLTGRAIGVVRWVTMPVRQIIRPFAIPLRPLAAMRARRAAAEAARRAALLEAARMESSIGGVLYRMAISTGKHAASATSRTVYSHFKWVADSWNG